MTIDQVGQNKAQQAGQTQQPQAQNPQSQNVQPHADTQSYVINSNEIRAILYLGIRGKISLPVEHHKVDVLA
jgi:hypothetical protein